MHVFWISLALHLMPSAWGRADCVDLVLPRLQPVHSADDIAFVRKEGRINPNTGRDGGVHRAWLLVNGVEVQVVQKTITFPKTFDDELLQSFREALLELNIQASERGFAPRLYGYRVGSVGDRRVLVLYSEELGVRPDLVVVDGKPLVGHWLDLIRGDSEARILDLVGAEEIAKAHLQYRRIAKFHPDANRYNMMVEIIRRADGSAHIRVVGVDWDHPQYRNNDDPYVDPWGYVRSFRNNAKELSEL